MAFDLRTTIVQTAVMDEPLREVIGDRLLQYGQDKEVERPFVVYRLGLEVEIPNWRDGPVDKYSDFWVNDNPGDYQRIDDIIARLRVLYTALHGQNEFIEARYVSKGPELMDPQLGTILRVARFQFTTSH